MSHPPKLSIRKGSFTPRKLILASKADKLRIQGKILLPDTEATSSSSAIPAPSAAPKKASSAARKKAAAAVPKAALDTQGLPLEKHEGEWLPDLIRLYPVGQKRSAPLPLRQFVFMAGPEVIKGPYQPDDVKLDTILRRSAQFKEWRTPNTIHPTSLIQADEGVYLVMDNIGEVDEPVLEMNYKESFSEFVYDVLLNNPAMPLNQFFNDPKNKTVDKGRYITKELILSLCHCAILSVGDCQIRNFLVDPRTGRVLVTDYDEARGPATVVLKGEMFYLTKAPGKAYKWPWYARPHLAYCAAKCREITIDETLFTPEQVEVFRKRLAKVVELLDFYSSPDAPIPEQPVPIRSGKKSTPRKTKANEEPAKPKTPKAKTAKPKTPKAVGSLVASERAAPVYKGPFASTNRSEHGFSPDILKSGMQKYVRRNNRAKAFACLSELLSFAQAGDAAKGIIANTLNRVMTIAAEDVGLANVGLVTHVIHEVFAMKKDVDRPALFKLVAQLCASPKTRVMSHAYYVYANPASAEERAKYDIEWESEATRADAEQPGWAPFLPSDSDELVRDALVVLHRLEERSLAAFTWVERFRAAHEKEKVKLRPKYVPESPYTGKTTGPMSLIWGLYAHYLAPDVYNELAHAYYNLSETRPFASLALLASVHRDRLPAPEVDIGGWKDDYEAAQTYASELVIDDYVVDKHTQQGRQEGADTLRFVTEGSLVDPEDLSFRDETLLAIYQARA